MRLRSDGAFIAAAVLAFVVTRIASFQPYLGTLDATNFALALREFDPARYQPHFPGYPVYVAAARGLYELGMPAPSALELPAVGVGALATIALFVALRRWLGAPRAKLTVLAWIAAPGLWLAAGQPTSDGLGLAWYTLAVALLGARWPKPDTPSSKQLWLGVGIGALLGLGLGVRLSYFPIVISAWLLAFAAPGRRLAVGVGLGVALGVALWIVPMTLVLGPREMIDLGVHAATGHFTTWGGAISAEGAPTSLERARLFGWSFVSHGLGATTTVAGGIVALVLLVAIGGAALGRAPSNPGRRSVLGFVAALALPYLLWMALGQNPEKPRHVLPLLALALPLVGACMPGFEAKESRGRALAFTLTIAWVLSMLWIGTDRLGVAKHHSTPSFQIVQHVATYEEPEGLVLYGGEEVRLFAYYAPWFRAKRARDVGDVLADLEGGLRPRRILVTSKVAGLPNPERDPAGDLTSLGTFLRDPMVDPHYAHIELYALNVERARAVLRDRAP